MSSGWSVHCDICRGHHLQLSSSQSFADVFPKIVFGFFFFFFKEKVSEPSWASGSYL
jgi:hypothetical protein